MIKEMYCSYELSKLLKEKGFKESTQLVWYEHLPSPNAVHDSEIGKPKRDYFYWEKEGERNSTWTNDSPIPSYISGEVYSCPTHQIAMAWLREVHNIDIDIEPSVGMLGIKVYVPFISTYKPLKDDPSKVRQIKRGIYYKDDRGVIPSLQHFDSYDEAVEAACLYVLNNLI